VIRLESDELLSTRLNEPHTGDSIIRRAGARIKALQPRWPFPRYAHCFGGWESLKLKSHDLPGRPGGMPARRMRQFAATHL
jgi:hypothetical protein